MLQQIPERERRKARGCGGLDVQLEHGYTRLANELLEALACAPLPGPRHFQVMLAMIRLLYGYNRSSDRISSSQVATVTGLDVSNVRSVLRELLHLGLLESTGGSQGRTGQWRIQKDPDQWVNLSRRRPRLPTTQVADDLGRGRLKGRVVDDSSTRVVDDSYQRQKDSSPKTKSPRSRAAARTQAPDALEGPEVEALERWAAETLPEQRDRVPELVAECLDHFRGTGKPMANWTATCRNWIRRDLGYRRERGGSLNGGRSTQGVRPGPLSTAIRNIARRQGLGIE